MARESQPDSRLHPLLSSNRFLDLLAEESRALPEAELKKRMSELKQEMEVHKGEFFLVASREWKEGLFKRRYYSSSGSFKPPTDWHIEQDVRMGICTPPYLEAKVSLLTVHTAKNVLYSQGRIHSFDGPVNDLGLLYYDLERPLPKKDSVWVKDPDNPGVALQIIVGDEAASNWFLEESISLTGHDLLERIKDEDPLLYQEQVKKHRMPEVLLAFYKMQKALGRFLPEQPDGVVSAVNQEKGEIVNKLLALSERDTQLTQQIARIYQVPEEGGVMEESGGVTLVEDEDDAFFVSWGGREELKRTRGEVEELLKHAFELDMHKTSEIVRREIRPGQTVEIDMPRLVCGFAQYYEIPLPKD